MVFGYNTSVTKEEDDEHLENLALDVYNVLGASKYDNYKENLPQDSSNNDEIEYNNIIPPVEPPLPVISSGPMDSPWPMYKHNVKHTGRSPYSTSHITDLEKWRYPSPGWIQAGGVIDNDGIIYFGGHAGDLYAIYPNGTLKWKCDIGSWIDSSCAIAEDGTIYVPTSNPWDGLFAVNPNGTKKWRYDSGEIFTSPTIADDGTIYFGTFDGGPNDLGSMYALYPNGTLKWRFRTGYAVLSSPVIDDNGNIYFGSHDTYLYALYPNGTMNWKFKTDHWVRASPCIGDDGTIFCVSIGEYIYAIYPNNGTLKWKAGGGAGTSPSVGPDGLVYAGWDKLRAFYPNNGTVKWIYDLGNSVVEGACPVTSAEGLIYFGTRILEVSGGHIICLNSDGIEQWRKRIATEGWVDGTPCIGPDGTIYIGCSILYNSYLHAFGPVESNSPPETPVISGKVYAKVGDYLEYMFRAIDPDLNPISYYIEWGDGDIENWCREYASNEKHYVAKTYSEPGNFTIRAKVRDVFNEESGWGTFNVTIEKKNSRAMSSPLLLWLLQRFPLLNGFLILLIK